MGTWGTNAFENDTAMDWQDAFLANPRPAKLGGCFTRLLRQDDEDADLEAEALAAAEVLAALRGHASTALPDGLADWSSRSRAKLKDEWLDSAREAIAKIAARSELRELWAESGDLQGWQSTVQDLAERLNAPLRPRPKRPRGPKIWLLRESGAPTSITYVASDPRLPDLAEPGWRCQSARIDIRSPFSRQDYAVLADWLSAHPEVLVIFEDGQFGEVLDLDDDDWQIVEEGLLAFAGVSRLRLELSPLRDLDFLRGFERLAELDLSLAAPCDLSALPSLSHLRRFSVQTSAGNLLDPASQAAAPRFDMAALNGIHAGYVSLEYCRLVNAAEHVAALTHCHTLVFDFFFEEGLFELPSLSGFAALRRLQCLPRSPQCLQSALDAPGLAELILYTDMETLAPAMDRIRDSSTLTHLGIMLQKSHHEPFLEADDVVADLGKQMATRDGW